MPYGNLPYMPTLREPKTPWGRRVRERRIALGLDQAELSKRSDIVQPTISDIETGRIRFPNDRLRLALATALECEVADLFPYDEIPEVAS